MNKKLIWLIICSLVFIPSVYAECSNSELSKVKSLASAIKFEKKYIGNSSEDEYGILITGMSDGFLVSYNDKVYFNNEIISGLKPKQTYILYVIYGANSACSMKMNYTRRITMPAYNKYHNNEICTLNGDISYCNITYDTSKMTEEQFVNKVNEYLDSQNVKPIEVEDTNYIIYIVIGGAVLLIAVIIFILSKSKKKKAFL